MKKIILNWAEKYLSNVEAIVLLLWLGAASFLIIGMGHIFAPVFASIVLAYLLHGLVKGIQPYLGRLPSVLLVYLLFVGLFFTALFLVIPILGQQLTNLFEEVPKMGIRLEELFNRLPIEYRDYFMHERVVALTESFLGDIRTIGRAALTGSIASIPSLVTWLLYLVLVPLMVFFFLKDYRSITQWLFRFLPENRPALSHIWSDADQKMGNYIRGKGVEAIIVGVATYICFITFQLQYAALLSCLVGLSVLIPYVGTVLVSIPVVIVALFQWGLSPDFAWAMFIYAAIQVVDGNVVVPLLFSEAVSLHPLVIILALLCFGGIWGLWGMFFAIPLAVFLNAVLDGWPKAIGCHASQALLGAEVASSKN